MVASHARMFSIVSVVIAIAVLLIFVGLNGGLHDKMPAGMIMSGALSAL